MPDEPMKPLPGERILDWWESVRVRWFMLDAQAKQALVLGAAYAAYTLMDVAAALVKRRIERGGKDGE